MSGIFLCNTLSSSAQIVMSLLLHIGIGYYEFGILHCGQW